MNKIELLKKELRMTRDENIRKDIEEAIKKELIVIKNKK